LSSLASFDSEGGRIESTKVAFATDIHRDRRIFRWLDTATHDYDIIAVGGDLDDPYAGLPNFKFNYIMHKLKPNVVRDRILELNEANVEKPVLLVLGNHDNPDSRALHGRSVATASGFIVGGVGGSLPSQISFPFEVEEKEYTAILKQLGPVDILITHQPPYGTKCDVASTGQHVGSRAIKEYVVREQPKLVLTGHIHESPAIDVLFAGKTTIINPGPFFTGNYGAVELYADGVRTRIMGVGTNRELSSR
jgi:Icc-related predicted phosphoesterase